MCILIQTDIRRHVISNVVVIVVAVVFVAVVFVVVVVVVVVDVLFQKFTEDTYVVLRNIRCV